MSTEKIYTPTKTHTRKSTIASPHSSPVDNMNLDILSDQMNIDLKNKSIFFLKLSESAIVSPWPSPKYSTHHNIPWEIDPKKNEPKLKIIMNRCILPFNAKHQP